MSAPVSPELLRRLPRTFAPALKEALDRWDLLFPAERRRLATQLHYLSSLPAARFDDLFRPIKDVEARMRLPDWASAGGRMSIEGTSVLVRSPLYSEWRAEVERAFALIDSELPAAPAARRLILCLLPAAGPADPAALWPRLSARGRWIPLRESFGEPQPRLLTSAAPGEDPSENAWAFDAGDALLPAPGLTLLSFQSLAAVRREFLSRLNLIRKDLRSADATYAGLRRLPLGPLLPPPLRDDARIAAFLRDLFLSGNGSMLFGNSFVEWGAAEAMRRAQPRSVVCRFGIRHGLKPFSSVVLFEDQERANPVPPQHDPAGSLIDAAILAEYVFLMAERLPPYAGRTLGLFTKPDWDRVLAVGAEPPALRLSREVLAWAASWRSG